ncbi:nitroreductase family protein [Caproiciproducens sp. R1]|uniref:nitroreductase family protein n=1 Tax=Caproiciproducens sp. R1 TaxID=3435000 RepID=UPI00403389E6
MRLENEVLKQLGERKSVRVFENREVSQDVKNEIIASAFEAPTAGNMMLYTIIDVTDSKRKEQLSVLCDHQPFIAKAPVVLVFAADYDKWYKMFSAAGLSPRRPGPGDLLLACSDALIAAQNSVTAAHSLGLGSCYIGDILENCEKVRELLSLPEYTLPAVMVVYGYPTQQQKERGKPGRFAKEHIVHTNSYREMQPEELLRMYGDNGSRESLEAFCKRKYMSDFSLEMNRSVSEYLKNFMDR